MKSSEKIWNRRFILLFITSLLVLAAFYASIPIIPIYCQEIGITGSKGGIVLTAMSVATILFRPVAGYLLDNFNRYRVYLVFLALFCLSFPAFLAFPLFGALIVIRLYMGAVYSVCGSATMTLAGDVLPAAKITEGISRFAFTVSIGMAVGPYVGLQVQSHMSSAASFWTIFGITVAALVWIRPPDSVSGTRWTRWTPDSNFSRDQAPSPSMTAEQSFTPPSSVSLMLAISSFQPWLSAYMVYIRRREWANRALSSPPTPPRISRITFRLSLGSLGSRRIVSFSFSCSSSLLFSSRGKVSLPAPIWIICAAA